VPVAKPPISPKEPAPVPPDEANYIRECVRRYYGDDAVIRNYGPDPRRLELHVETDAEPGLERHECLGLLMCEINRDYIGLVVTKRGSRIRGSAKIAYRQGQLL
jgi:integrase